MNREIKFRAWDKNGEGMFIGIEQGIEFSDNSNYTFDQFLNPLPDDIHDWAIMQYIGLKDKNGVEIFEGDIVKDCEDGDLSEVAFMDGAYVYVGFCESITNRHWVDFEVVGNVWEHKELLESK